MTQTTIQGGHGDLPLYLATPASPRPWPGVVVIHDAMGMGQDTRNQADWLASEGFLAVAPDLFSWGRTLTCLRTTIRAMRQRQGRDLRGGGGGPGLADPPAEDAPDLVARACPIVGSFGGKDLTLRGAAARLESALSAAGVTHDVREYPAGGHGFLNDHRAAGDPIPLAIRATAPLMHFDPEPAAAADARRRIIEFFGAHLRDQQPPSRSRASS